MARINYIVAITRLGPAESREITHEADGISYRAEILMATTRAYKVRMSEPVEAFLDCELPLFVVGMTHYRFVKEGRATAHLLQSVQGRMVSHYKQHLARLNDPHHPTIHQGD
jgi:hypothetical protein